MLKTLLGFLLFVSVVHVAFAQPFIEFADGKVVENPWGDLQEINPGPNANVCIDEAEAEVRLENLLVEEGLERRWAKACIYQMHLAGLMVSDVVFGEEPDATHYVKFVSTMRIDQDIKTQYYNVLRRTERFLNRNKLTILEDEELLGNYYLSILYNCVDLNKKD